MRMRQCLSYTALLGGEVIDYNENLLEGSTSLSDIIKHYDDLETPSKVDHLVQLVQDLCQRKEKVVIWSNFVRTLEMLRDTLQPLTGVRLIYGFHSNRAFPEFLRNLPETKSSKNFWTLVAGSRYFLQIQLLVQNPSLSIKYARTRSTMTCPITVHSTFSRLIEFTGLGALRISRLITISSSMKIRLMPTFFGISSKRPSV